MTIEQFLFEQLEKIAPGKYTLASVLQRLKSGLRFPCTHLKGGKGRSLTFAKDYNIAVFNFADRTSEVKCLYGCGLKIRVDSKEKPADFIELASLPTTNSVASSEVFKTVSSTRGVLPLDPGPIPTYTDADRARIQEREDGFWKWAKAKPEEYHKRFGNVDYNHPDPIEAPESVIPRQMKAALANVKSRPPVLKATVTFQDEGIPALEPVKKHTKIRKARKTQSRRKTNKK